MNVIDEIFTEFPYYGSPRITAELKRRKQPENHKRIERLMKLMGLQALYPRPRTSIPQPAHLKYPYLLKGLQIVRPDQIWGTDITYIRAEGMWFYLVAIIDWFSRYVLSWRLAETMEVASCIETLEDALTISIPDIHNSDQGSQFTAEEYIAVIKRHPTIQISMDGRGRCFDNIFTERLWRTVKYEEVYVKEYKSGKDARASLGEYFVTYNTRRLHSAINYKTPAEVYFGRS
jgi:putative transposase